MGDIRPTVKDAQNTSEKEEHSSLKERLTQHYSMPETLQIKIAFHNSQDKEENLQIQQLQDKGDIPQISATSSQRRYSTNSATSRQRRYPTNTGTNENTRNNYRRQSLSYANAIAQPYSTSRINTATLVSNVKHIIIVQVISFM